MVNKRTSLFLITLLLLVVSISAVSATTDDSSSDSSVSTASSDVATISDSDTGSSISDTGSSSSDSSSSSTPTSTGSDYSAKTVSSDTGDVKSASTSTTSSKDTSGSSDLSSNDVKTQTIKTSSSSDDVKSASTIIADDNKNIKASSESSNLKTADSDTGSYTVSNYDELKTTIDTIKSSDVEDNVITLNPSEGTYYIDQTIVWGDDSQVATNLTIVGNGVTLDGQGKYKFLNISEGYTLTLQNVTVTNCFYNGTLQTMTPTYGGAIGNFGTLIVEDSVFSKNNLLATQGGGAIANGGTLILTNTNFTDNLSDNGEEGSGAALYNNEGNITATNCSFVGNQAQCAPVLYDDYNYLIGDEIRSTVTLTDCYIGENIITTPWEFMYGYVYNAYTTLNLVNTELDDSLIADYGGVVNRYTGKNTTISVSDATGQYSKTALIVATITDSDGKLVNEGQVAFKLNGVTIKDDDGNNVLVNVRNGVARLNYTITNNPGTYTISASYSGSDNYFSARTENDATLTVENRVANLTIASKSNNLKSGERLLITVVVSDNGKYVSDGVVIYKLNGVTLKDEEGNNLQSTLSKGVATLEYTIPVDMAGKDYTLTAVYSGKNFDRAEQNATLTLIKSNVTAVISPSIIDQGENATVSVTLFDQNGNQLERSTKVTIKANGKTLLNTETVNGVLNVTIPTDTFKNPYYNLTVIFGENSAYNELRLNTTLVVESNSNVADLKTQLKADSEYNVGSYSELVSTINTIKSGTDDNIVITLTPSNDTSAYSINSDIEWGNADATQTPKSLTINGNGVTLDDSNGNKFLKIYEGYTVVLENMTIDSCATSDEGQGGIIDNNGNAALINIEIPNSFISGFPYDGGLLYNSGEMTITNITFNNTAYMGSYNGGIICNTGNMEITNIVVDVLQSYASPVSGGVIFNNGTISIVNANISSISSGTGLIGGVIYNAGEMTLENGIIDGISVPGSVTGGLIYNEKDLTIKNSTFSNTNITNGTSTVIQNAGTFNFVNSTLTSTTWSNQNELNGSIINNTATANIINSTISDTSSVNQTSNGTILNYGSDSTLTIINSTIINNTAGIGGAINNQEGNLILTTNTFSNNYGQQNETIYNTGKFQLDNNIFQFDDVSIFCGNEMNFTSPIIDTTLSETDTITFKITDENGNVVTENVTKNDDNIIQLSYIFTASGNYIVSIEYPGNDINFTVQAYKFNSTVTVENISDTFPGDSITITGSLFDANNQPLGNSSIIITVNNGENITTTTNENGTYSANYTVDTFGINNVTVTYPGSEAYEVSITTTTFISRINTTVLIDQIPDSLDEHMITISGKLLDINNNPADNELVYIIVNDVDMLNATTDENGIYSINYTLNVAGVNNITVIHLQSDRYAGSSNITSFVARKTTTITAIDVTSQYKDEATLTAIVTDSDGDVISEGQVAFKINSVTLRDEDNNNILVDVVNGTATLNYSITYNPGTYTITGLYYGTDNYLNSKSDNATLTVTERTVDLYLSPDITTIKPGETITALVEVDDNGYATDSGEVIFKLNGVTLKDDNQNEIRIPVTNASAILTYEIPKNMSAKAYNLTVVYSNKNYQRTEYNSPIDIIRSDVITQVDPVYVTRSNNATLSMVLYDQDGNIIDRSTKIAVKANGKTILNSETGSGTVELTLPTDTFKNTYYNLTIVLGENSQYNKLTLDTILITQPATITSQTTSSKSVSSDGDDVTITWDNIADYFTVNNSTKYMQIIDGGSGLTPNTVYYLDLDLTGYYVDMMTTSENANGVIFYGTTTGVYENVTILFRGSNTTFANFNLVDAYLFVGGAQQEGMGYTLIENNTMTGELPNSGGAQVDYPIYLGYETNTYYSENEIIFRNNEIDYNTTSVYIDWETIPSANNIVLYVAGTPKTTVTNNTIYILIQQKMMETLMDSQLHMELNIKMVTDQKIVYLVIIHSQ